MREYLDLEFHDIEPALSFDYNLERIIDDFVLLAVFVGNDFLPHLPNVHIRGDGLERLFEIYKQVLPSFGTLICNLGPMGFFLTIVQMGILTRVVPSIPCGSRYFSIRCGTGNKRSSVTTMSII